VDVSNEDKEVKKMVKLEKVKIDETKGALLPKIEEPGDYVITEVSVDQRTRRRDLPGRGKAGESFTLITVFANQLDENGQAVTDESGEPLVFRQPVELIPNPGPSSNLGKMILAWGDDTDEWVGKKFFASIKTIEGRPVVEINPRALKKKEKKKRFEEEEE
jgi:hypothetical protein